MNQRSTFASTVIGIGWFLAAVIGLLVLIALLNLPESV